MVPIYHSNWGVRGCGASDNVRRWCPGGSWPAWAPSTSAIRLLVSIVVATGLLLPASSQTYQQSNTVPSALDQFKKFISSPAPIKNLVFQKKVPIGGGVRPLDGSFAQSAHFELYQARWQTNGVLLRPMGSLSDITNFAVTGHLISWSGHQHALWEPNWFFTTWDDRDPSVAGKEFSIFYTSRFYLGSLRELLNFGILFAGIGSVHWEGNRFLAECDVDHQHLQITGEITPTADGYPDYMNVRYQWPNQTFNHLVRYDYSQHLNCSFLPRVVKDFWISGTSGNTNGAVEVNEWRILALELADGPLDSKAFDAEPFARQNLWKRRIYKNSGLYIQRPDGTVQFAGTFDLDKQNRAPRRVGLGLFYGGWGGLNIAIFVLMVRAKKRQNP